MFGCSPPPAILYRSGLGDVLSLHALPVLGHLVGDLLTFLKRSEPGTLYVRVADEDVPTPVGGGDEAVAFLLVEQAKRSLGRMLEPAFLCWGSTATKKPPFLCGRRFHQNKTQVLCSLSIPHSRGSA